MRYWKDLTTEEQSDYSEGVVELYGFKWDCYYKFVTGDTVEVYSEQSGWSPSLTSHKSLVVLL